MPKYLKLIARFANSGAIAIMLLLVLYALGKGKFGMALFLAFFAALLSFNLYLIEKSALLLSEEEWLKSEVRKVFLRRKLRRLAEEEAKETDKP
ncbi:hypothetical protein [Pelagibius marinus]|uniref:hypothetical protein n=1 Tax=Pelagibius marinus TaxID=2762760 RepID=UPI0018725AED|nr:hypothetical protein [Pelagibius marinus]